jgi:hypothetical protein
MVNICSSLLPQMHARWEPSHCRWFSKQPLASTRGRTRKAAALGFQNKPLSAAIIPLKIFPLEPVSERILKLNYLLHCTREGQMPNESTRLVVPKKVGFRFLAYAPSNSFHGRSEAIFLVHVRVFAFIDILMMICELWRSLCRLSVRSVVNYS